MNTATGVSIPSPNCALELFGHGELVHKVNRNSDRLKNYYYASIATTLVNKDKVDLTSEYSYR